MLYLKNSTLKLLY